MPPAAPAAPFTIYCDAAFPADAEAYLAREQGGHRLVRPATLKTSNLAAGVADPLLADADVAFGQPDPQQVIALPRLKWVHLTTAGYTRYDRDDLRAALAARGGQLTTSSGVYEEPCAEHAFAFMLALARQLPAMVMEQFGTRPGVGGEAGPAGADGEAAFRGWRQPAYRASSRLLTGQSAILYGYGTIARRLTELLAPFRMDVVGVRRRIVGDEPARVVTQADADAHLPRADHVFNILPSAAGTDGYFTAERFAKMKPGAVFYNIGRGTTVDQPALIAALKSGHLSAAYLDVTDPEPLPKDHPLWDAPNCYVTPHTAGGHDTEFRRLAEHFVANLRRYERGGGLADRVI
jgi:phosphoglycerate dehydrogenase-like enzyme